MNMNLSNELIPNANDRIICVKVGKITRENFYEMARKYWAVKIDRAKKATHVLAIVGGHVSAVYIPQELSTLTCKRYGTREDKSPLSDGN